MNIQQLAGWLDAEGCFRLERNGVPKISVGQTRPQAIEAVRELYPTGRLYLYKNPNHPTWKRVLTLAFTSNGAVNEVLEAVIQQLRIKKCEAEWLLDYTRNRDQYDSSRTADLDKRLRAAKRVYLEIEAEKTQSKSKPLCFIEDCLDFARSRRMCSKHYQQEKKRLVEGGSWIPEIYHPFLYARKPTDEELSYISGLFDGDGNVYFDEGKLAITFGQTSDAGIQLVKDIYGGNIRFKPTRGNRRPQAWYQIQTRAGCLQFLKDVFPRLLEKKKEVSLIINAPWKENVPLDEKATRKLTRQLDKLHNYEIPANYLEDYESPKRINQCASKCRLCDKKPIWRDLCSNHRRRLKLYSDPTLKKVTRGRSGQSILVRDGEAAPLYERFCSVEGCNEEFAGKGFCNLHLSHFNKYGDPLLTKRRIKGKWKLVTENSCLLKKRRRAIACCSRRF